MSTSLTDGASSHLAYLGVETDEGPVYGRSLAPKAGRALEILGHAIEYLADEYVRDDSPAEAKEGRLQAIQMLMALNREIYLSCPVAPDWGERLRTLLRMGRR